MTSLKDPNVIVIEVAMFTVLVCIMSKTDPVMLFARWGFALRRIVLIGASTIGSIPRELSSRLKAGRLRDSAALAELDKPYSVKQASPVRAGQPAQIAEYHPRTAPPRKSCKRRRSWPMS
jgi:hypothetical protein